MTTTWTADEGRELCRQIELVAPAFGCHVALTGGLLYKEGARKDCDLLFYRIRQEPNIDVHGLFMELKALLGIERLTPNEVWCIKALYAGKKIDCFFPEVEEGSYPEAESED